MKTVTKLFAMFICFLIRNSYADGITQLDTFLKQTQSSSGHFTQTQKKANTQKLQQSEGNFVFSRPGRFIWEYQKPFEQRLQSDGKKLYIYDKDLAQVTIKPVDASLGATPAAILFGSDLKKHFRVQNAPASKLPENAGLDWVYLLPKSADTQFKQVALAFNKEGIAKMRLLDQFNHQVQIEFSSVQKNPAVSAKDFVFVAPKEVDVIGE